MNGTPPGLATRLEAPAAAVHVSRRGSIDLVYGALRDAPPASPTAPRAPTAPPAGAPPAPALLAMAEERDAALAREAHWRVRFLAEQAQLQSVVANLGQQAASAVASINTQHAEADAKREAADAARNREENILRETAQFQRDAAAKAKAAASEMALELIAQQASARDELEERRASSAREIGELREELSAVRGSAAHLREQLRGAEAVDARVASENVAAAQLLRAQLDAAQSVAEERARALLLAVTEHDSAHRATRAEHAAEMDELAQGHAAAHAAARDAHATERGAALAAHGDALAGELREAHAADLRAMVETHDGALRAMTSAHESHRERAATEHGENASTAAAAAREEIVALKARLALEVARAAEAGEQARRVALEAERARARHHAELRRQVRQYSAISAAKSAQLSFEHASTLDAVETHYAAQLSAAAVAHDAAIDAESRRNAANVDSVLRTVAAAVNGNGGEESGPPVAAPRDAAQLRLECLEAELATLAASTDGARTSRGASDGAGVEGHSAAAGDFDTLRRVDALTREVERQREQLSVGAAEHTQAHVQTALSADEQEDMQAELLALAVRVAETDDSLVLAAAERRVAVLEIALRRASELGVEEQEGGARGAAQRTQLSRIVIDAVDLRQRGQRLEKELSTRDARLRAKTADHDVEL